MLIEKAWAKVHGAYSNTILGDTDVGLRVITGAPVSKYVIRNKYKKDPR